MLVTFIKFTGTWWSFLIFILSFLYFSDILFYYCFYCICSCLFRYTNKPHVFHSLIHYIYYWFSHYFYFLVLFLCILVELKVASKSADFILHIHKTEWCCWSIFYMYQIFLILGHFWSTKIAISYDLN